MFGGGRQIRIASVLRFCTIAVRWSSSRAPERPKDVSIRRRETDVEQKSGLFRAWFLLLARLKLDRQDFVTGPRPTEN
jgi:hypothetical protein